MKYPLRSTIILSFAELGFGLSQAMAAPVVQVVAGVESSKFVNGLSISDSKPVANFASEISFDNGSFAGLDCYKSETLFFRDGIDTGCSFHLGYFAPTSDTQAISATVSRSEYTGAPAPARQWNYTTVNLNWHSNRSTVFTLSRINDWFGRGYSAISLTGAYQFSLNERTSATLEASYTDFDGNAPISGITRGRLSLHYGFRERWSAELNLHLNESDINQLIQFETQQLEATIGLSYRFY